MGKNKIFIITAIAVCLVFIVIGLCGHSEKTNDSADLINLEKTSSDSPSEDKGNIYLPLEEDASSKSEIPKDETEILRDAGGTGVEVIDSKALVDKKDKATLTEEPVGNKDVVASEKRISEDNDRAAAVDSNRSSEPSDTVIKSETSISSSLGTSEENDSSDDSVVRYELPFVPAN